MQQPKIPLSKRLKAGVIRVVMFVLGRALQSASRLDPTVRREVADWEDGYSIIMRVLPRGPAMGLAKRGNRLKYLGGKLSQADLVISFKNTEAAFLVFAGLIGAETGFAQHRMSVKGDLPGAMSFIRCVNLLEAYLFPKFISRRILKEVPPMGFQRWSIRLAIMVAGIPFGI
jgi:hypothetical protein